jgi:hypothetical protein
MVYLLHKITYVLKIDVSRIPVFNRSALYCFSVCLTHCITKSEKSFDNVGSLSLGQLSKWFFVI